MKTSLARLFPFFGLAFLLSACVSFSDESVEEPVAKQAVTAEVVASPLEVWLAEAPKPEKVACSVTESTAPTAVEEFNTLSNQIYTLYQQIYDDAQTVSSHGVAPTALDVVTEEERTAWRTQAQAAITANYQSAVQAIEAQRKGLAVYTENLRSDASITNITNRVQQQMAIGQICKDSLRLGEQLTSAGKGASLILQQRIETTLEK